MSSLQRLRTSCVTSRANEHAVELLRRSDFSTVRLDALPYILHRHIQHMTHLVDDLLEAPHITQGKASRSWPISP